MIHDIHKIKLENRKKGRRRKRDRTEPVEKNLEKRDPETPSKSEEVFEEGARKPRETQRHIFVVDTTSESVSSMQIRRRNENTN